MSENELSSITGTYPQRRRDYPIGVPRFGKSRRNLAADHRYLDGTRSIQSDSISDDESMFGVEY